MVPLSDIRKYERSVSLQAWKDTWEFLPFTPKHTIYGFITGLAALVYAYFAGHEDAVMDGLVGVGIAIGAIVIFNAWERTCAPCKIHKELEDKLKMTQDEKLALEKRLQPCVSISYEGNKTPPYYHTDDRRTFQLLRIGIRNDGFTYLEGVRAKLMGVKQLKEGIADPLFNGKFPAALHLKGDNPPYVSMKEFAKEFSVNARSTEYVDVARWVYNTDRNDTPWVQFMWAEKFDPLDGPFGHYIYELDIQVTTRSGDEIFKKYRTKINPFGLEEMSENNK